jgi:predicted nucleotidyltransferase component of viral defense system
VTKNVAASIHQRLLNHARANDRPFNEVLQYFALERFLYRLGCSPFRQQFVLKGALMLTAWQFPYARPTRDIDLLGCTDNVVEHIVSTIQAICRELAPEDGLVFDADSVTGESIIEAANYAGVRVRFAAHLGTARVPMQIDIGFGDPVVPAPSPVKLPTILGLPAPELQGYSRESMIAEKVQVMVYLAEVNSRMKDFYDVWWLATHFEFDGPLLAQAIHETFQWRQTPLSLTPVAFSDRFTKDETKQGQWRAFIRRLRLDDVPGTLTEATETIAAFILPVFRALIEEKHFDQCWAQDGPWVKREK